jgi:hypothetical protein
LLPESNAAARLGAMRRRTRSAIGKWSALSVPRFTQLTHQSQVPEQGTKVPALAATVAEEPVSPVAEAVTVIVPAPVA